MPIMMMQVNSSAIRAVGYDTDDNTLYIEFNKTRGYPTYQYANVSPHTAGRIFKARSIGQYYHNIIKPRADVYNAEPSTWGIQETMDYRRGSGVDIVWSAAKRYAEQLDIL